MHQTCTREFTFIHVENDGMSQDKNREPVPENDIPDLLELAADNRLEEFSKSIQINYSGKGDSFIDFGQITNKAGNFWRLGELLNIKYQPSTLDPEGEYAEPGLNSQSNTVKIRGNFRLGKNIKGKNKIIAEPGDLIIATLHTNSGNGLFAIADRHYVCTSQVVAEIRSEVIPTQYLFQALRREFPRQLIPTDLVGRETFTEQQILDVVIPKPNSKDMARLIKVESEIERLQAELNTRRGEIKTLLDHYGGVQG